MKQPTDASPRVLVTLLGRSRDGGYQSTTYRLPDGEDITTPLLGEALAKKLRPDTLIIIGTAGSMWDYWVGQMRPGVLDDPQSLAAFDALDSACREQRASEALIAPLLPGIGQLFGCDVVARVVPAGRDEDEQNQLFASLADALCAQPGARVWLDITHGLRHLPLFALTAAYLAQSLAQVRIEAAYYGAFELKADGPAPVLDLAHLLQVMRWIQTFSTFDASGDLRHLLAPLREMHMAQEALRHLEKAAHFESVFNHDGARQESLSTLKAIDAPHTSPHGALAQFMPRLNERLGWARDADGQTRLAQLAGLYLKNGDYVRAAIAGQKAFIVGLCQKDERISDYDVLLQAGQEFRQGRRGDPAQRNDYEELAKIRNALAHGAAPKSSSTQKTIADADRLKNELCCLLHKLLPDFDGGQACHGASPR